MDFAQNSLTSCIYDMALGKSSWDRILDVLSMVFPGCLVTASGDDLVTRSNIVFSQRGLAPAAVAAYVGTYAALNPWLDGQGGLAPLQIYHDDQLVPRSEARQTPFYRRWLQPHGDFAAATGVVVLREGTRQLVLEIRYPEARELQLRDRAASVLREASSHLERAIELSSRFRIKGGRSYIENVVAELPFAVFFVDQDMRIHYANEHAETLRRRGGPFTNFDGTLRATDEQTDGLLRQLVAKTVASARTPTSVLQISKQNEAERYIAIARQASRGDQSVQLHDAILDPGPLTVLVVHGSVEAASLPADLLWRAFSLTESEARLAEALVNGSTLADLAKAREVSKQTLRNQLVGVMRKTGTRRQSELVSLLTRLSLTCM